MAWNAFGRGTRSESLRAISYFLLAADTLGSTFGKHEKWEKGNEPIESTSLERVQQGRRKKWITLFATLLATIETKARRVVNKTTNQSKSISLSFLFSFPSSPLSNYSVQSEWILSILEHWFHRPRHVRSRIELAINTIRGIIKPGMMNDRSRVGDWRVSLRFSFSATIVSAVYRCIGDIYIYIHIYRK